ARVWDAASGRQLLVLSGDTGAVNAVAFSPDGRRLVTASDEGSVKVWDLTPAGSRDWLTITAHKGGVESVIYTSDGRRLATTGFTDGRDKVWDARTGALVAVYRRPNTAGAGIIPASGRNRVSVGPTSPDGTLTLGVTTDGV